MNRMTFLYEGNYISLFWEGELWKKVDRSLKGLFSLKKATSLQEAEELFIELEEKTAKQLAIGWLGKRALFWGEIQERLIRKGFSSFAIEQTRFFCQKMGALNDEALLQTKIEKEQKKGRGGHFALLKLRRVVSVKDHFLDPEKEKEALVTYLKKKKIDLNSLAYQEKGKLFLKLMGRGFTRDLIEEVFQQGKNQ